MENYQKYLNPQTLASLEGLDLQARMIVEGYVAGQHASPYHGFSVEFAQHREYVAGDDIRHVDWKVWSKTDKFYLKQYEEETNLLTYLLLDTSESMDYASGRRTCRSSSTPSSSPRRWDTWCLGSRTRSGWHSSTMPSAAWSGPRASRRTSRNCSG